MKMEDEPLPDEPSHCPPQVSLQFRASQSFQPQPLLPLQTFHSKEPLQPRYSLQPLSRPQPQTQLSNQQLLLNQSHVLHSLETQLPPQLLRQKQPQILQQLHHIPLPILTECNYPIWRIDFMAFVTANNLAMFYEKQAIWPGDLAQEFDLKTKSDHAACLLVASVAANSLHLRLSPNWVHGEPHEMMAEICRYFASQNNPWNHEILRRDAAAIKIGNKESVDDFLKRHAEHRSKMQIARCPGIENEQVTVTYIIHALRKDQYFGPYLMAHFMDLPGTIFECHQRLLKLEAKLQHMCVNEHESDEDPEIEADVRAEVALLRFPTWRQERLRQFAYKQGLKLGESCTDYVNKHLVVRKDMENEYYPGIENEELTVFYLVHGLLEHPVISNQMGLFMPVPKTIQLFRNKLSVLAAYNANKHR